MKRRGGKFGLFAWMCVAWLVIVGLFAVLAPWIPFVDDPEDSDLSVFGEGPSWSHWFGVDEIGRDVFARVVWGARMSLVIGFSATFMALVIGGTLGLIAGFRGGRFDSFVSATVDIALAVPTLILLLFVVAVFGRSLPVIIFSLAWLMVPFAARVIRAATLSEAHREHILAARTSGARDRRILTREVLPAVIPVIMTFALIVIGIVILLEGTLAFIGLSIPPPTPTWGSMISEGRTVLDDAAHIALFPSAVMFLTLLAINIIGDAVKPDSGKREGGVI